MQTLGNFIETHLLEVVVAVMVAVIAGGWYLERARRNNARSEAMNDEARKEKFDEEQIYE